MRILVREVNGQMLLAMSVNTGRTLLAWGSGNFGSAITGDLCGYSKGLLVSSDHTTELEEEEASVSITAYPKMDKLSIYGERK